MLFAISKTIFEEKIRAIVLELVGDLESSSSVVFASRCKRLNGMVCKIILWNVAR